MNDNPQYNSPNPADGFMKNHDSMVAFWAWGLGVQGSVMAILLWLSGSPEYKNKQYWLTPYFNTPEQYIITVIFGLLLPVFAVLAVLNSENVINVSPTHKRKKISLMMWIFIGFMFAWFNIAFFQIILSIRYAH